MKKRYLTSKNSVIDFLSLIISALMFKFISLISSLSSFFIKSNRLSPQNLTTFIIAGCSLFMSSKVEAAFKHPGIYYTKQELDFVKSKIQANQEPWKSAYAKLLATNPTSRQPQAVAIVPGSSDPNERKAMDEMTLDGEYAHACALLWYFTGEKKYADHAIKILNAWSIFKKIPMQLYLTWGAPHFINAAELMKHTPNSGWIKADIDKFSTMVDNEMWRQVGPPASQVGTNHGTTANEAQFAIAVFLDDQAKFDEAVVNFRWVAPKYIFMNYPNRLNGQCNETCRDLNHTKLGVLGLFYAAQTAWNQGLDLFKENEARFTTFAELHAGIMTGRTTVPKTLCDEKAGQAGKVYCQGNVSWSEPNGAPPCNETAWEILYNHLSRRLGKSMPHTEFMLKRNRPLGGLTKRNVKWETLIHAEQNYSGVTPPLGTDITKITAPTSVKQGQSINVSVEYTTSEKRDIVVMFQLAKSPWTTYKEARKSVNAGSGTATFTLDIPFNTPIASIAYQFQVYMSPISGGWDTKVDDIRQGDVSVTSGSVTGFDNINIESNISVFPNPSNDGLFHLSEETSFEVHDLQGHIMITGKEDLVNLTDAPKGVYILSIGSANIKLMR